jgi:hypothetical protein
MKIKILRLTFIMSLITLCLSYSYAQMESAYSVLSRARGSVNSYPQVARLLANDGLYFTSTAYLKEYLVRSDGRKARNIDAL